MARIPDAASALPVNDLDGRPVPLSDLWKDRTAVVVFLRHFG
jgi:hypothetical protein